MAADLIRKMKDLISTHKRELTAFLEAADPTADGLVPFDTWLRGLREVLSALLPWEDYVSGA